MSSGTAFCIVFGAVIAVVLLGFISSVIPSRQQRKVDRLKLQIEEEKLKRELLRIQGRSEEYDL